MVQKIPNPKETDLPNDDSISSLVEVRQSNPMRNTTNATKNV